MFCKAKTENRMSTTVNWKGEIGTIAGAFLPSDTKESWLARAAAAAKVSFRQVRSLYYGQTTDPKYSVAVKVLSAADRARLEEAQSDARKVADIYRGRAEALAHIDEDFHRPEIDALVTAARILGGGDRAGDQGA
jgi:hypothetical protein